MFQKSEDDTKHFLRKFWIGNYGRVVTSRIRILFLFAPLLYSCHATGNNDGTHGNTTESILESSLEAIANTVDRDKVKSIIAFANCTSPKGKYTTEIHTDSEGYSYFKQTYTYNPQAFEAKIYHKTQGFQSRDSTQTLSKEAIYTIRSHEFFNLILDVKQRFHEFSEPELIEVNQQQMYRIAARDELNHFCLLFFDNHSGLLNEIHLQNPENEKELLIITFSDWKKVDTLQLPMHIVISQSEQLYTFDFIKVQFNSPDFRQKK
ncbi:hypothetical protein [Emticicia sp. BO119]|uniref:hypothetical protein n=1 Tax=Emticicia sp. BO119 TaxID=2757768 RepID=UPI0015F0F25D|nr:hypothetical protein [Emticicia sp. BO119]MBA4851035.1 hypothetical protein [Emticicia sp. BO119]